MNDIVVYFPQGHIHHLLEFGDKDLPFTLFPCCCCRIEQASYHFPNHLVACSSIEYHLTLQCIAIPSKQYQTNQSFVQSFTLIHQTIPSFEVTLRHSDLPDYLINYATFTELMKKEWKESDHFEMEFLEE